MNYALFALCNALFGSQALTRLFLTALMAVALASPSVFVQRASWLSGPIGPVLGSDHGCHSLRPERLAFTARTADTTGNVQTSGISMQCRSKPVGSRRLSLSDTVLLAARVSRPTCSSFRKKQLHPLSPYQQLACPPRGRTAGRASLRQRQPVRLPRDSSFIDSHLPRSRFASQGSAQQLERLRTAAARSSSKRQQLPAQLEEQPPALILLE